MVPLTIAIPTYDRNAILAANLAKLLPQLTAGCKLLILDNASPTPVSETIGPLLAELRICSVTLVRHSTNIGCTANLLRCLELCGTEWLWILGDDDRPHENAIAIIMDDLLTFPNVSCLSYCGGQFARTTPKYISGTSEFVAAIDNFGQVLSISCNVYNAAVMRKYLQVGYHYGYSFAPHFAMLVEALGKEGRAILSTKVLIDEFATGTPTSAQWSVVRQWLGHPSLLELFPDKRTRHLFANALRNVLDLRVLGLTLLLMNRNGTSPELTRLYFNSIVERLFYEERTLRDELVIWSFRIILYFPRAGLGLARAAMAILTARKRVSAGTIDTLRRDMNRL